jgi:hypothetical protein
MIRATAGSDKCDDGDNNEGVGIKSLGEWSSNFYRFTISQVTSGVLQNGQVL